MASIEELTRERIRLYDEAPEKLATEAAKIQADLWRQLLPIITELDTDSEGRILQTDANINRVSAIIEALDVLLAGDEYRDAVREFLGAMDRGFQITNEIAEQIESGFEPKTAQVRLYNLLRDNAINSLIGEGIQSRVSQPFQQQLLENIATRAPLREAVKALEVVVIGDEGTDGRVAANVKVVTNTAQAVADRSYSAAVYEDLGVEWFRYVGGEIPTSRPFCKHREGEVYHRKEIEAWGRGENAGGLNDIKNDTWDGQIKGTNEATIFTNLGGWNCRHSLVPVNRRRVPPEVIARAKSEGYID